MRSVYAAADNGAEQCGPHSGEQSTYASRRACVPVSADLPCLLCFLVHPCRCSVTSGHGTHTLPHVASGGVQRRRSQQRLQTRGCCSSATRMCDSCTTGWPPPLEVRAAVCLCCLAHAEQPMPDPMHCLGRVPCFPRHCAAAGKELPKWTGPGSQIEINQTIAQGNITMAYITRNYAVESMNTLRSWCAAVVWRGGCHCSGCQPDCSGCQQDCCLTKPPQMFAV